ncbi:hypothetical protein GCM10022206_41430 [Streptomyces chiangmaiensis]
MGDGGYQGPDPWEIERAVERGYRRAQGEYVPPDGHLPVKGIATACCLVPAILVAFWVVGSLLFVLLTVMGVVHPWG